LARAVSLAGLRLIGFAFHPQTEEAAPVPRRAGDGAGDGREAGIGSILPDEAVGGDGYGVPHAPVLPHQDGAGPKSRLGGRLGDLAAGEPGKQFEGGFVVAAVEFLLDAPGDHAAEQIPGEGPDASWGNARRKFFDLARLNKPPIAIEAVERIDALFAVEGDINGKPPLERQRIRNERSRPLVTELEKWLRKQRAKLSADNQVAKAPGGSTHKKRVQSCELS
jgi:Transposase IS66 family